MSMEEIERATFYFCDLLTGNDDCPRKNECKRYALVKDVPYTDYGKYGFARLYNICKSQYFKMFMKMPPQEAAPEKIEETSNESSNDQN